MLRKTVNFAVILFALSIAISAALSVRVSAAETSAKTSVESVSPEVREAEVERLFLAREWSALNRLAKSPDLSARAKSLCANAFWTQGRWADALALMEQIADDYPAEVAPYARLLTALGKLRTGDRDGALQAARSLRDDAENFPLVRYYASNLLASLCENADEKADLLQKMLSDERDKSRRTEILTQLAKLDKLTTADAFELLSSSPRNEAALKAIANAPASPEKFYRQGYADYLSGNHKRAAELLNRVDFNSAFGERAAYYRLRSLQRLGRSAEAVVLCKELITREKPNYAARAIDRLRTMLSGNASASALAALQEAAKLPNASIAATALYTIASSRLSCAADAQKEFIERFPADSRADDIKFNNGWRLYLASEPQKALDEWKSIAGNSARLRYWRSKAYEALGEDGAAKILANEILKESPLSIYAFLVNQVGLIEIVDEPLPENFVPAEASELERWGFITHAHMLLAGKNDAPSRAKRAQLARWLGREWESYRALCPAAEAQLKKPQMSRALLEIAYPTPFRSSVERAAKRYGFDPFLIWAIMRQESSFNPTAASSAGASGLMQLMPPTAAEEAKRAGLKKYNVLNANDNIIIASSFINQLLKRFDRIEWVVAAYNAGGGNVGKWNKERAAQPTDLWIECIPFPETNNYAKKVLVNYAIYKKLYGAPDQQHIGFAMQIPAKGEAKQ